MTFKLPEGILSGDQFDGLTMASKTALVHMIEHGEVPGFIGKAMTAEEAVTYLEGWLDRNKVTLLEGGVDYLAALVRRIAISDEPEQPIEEFEAALASFTDEQLVAMTEADADEAEALRRDVIDRRRAMLADLLEVGKVLLRGAIASGLHAAMGELTSSSAEG